MRFKLLSHSILGLLSLGLVACDQPVDQSISDSDVAVRSDAFGSAELATREIQNRHFESPHDWRVFYVSWDGVAFANWTFEWWLTESEAEKRFWAGPLRSPPSEVGSRLNLNAMKALSYNNPGLYTALVDVTFKAEINIGSLVVTTQIQIAADETRASAFLPKYPKITINGTEYECAWYIFKHPWDVPDVQW